MSKEIDSGISMYEFNRANMGQLPYLETEEEIASAKAFLKQYIKENGASFYMMLNYDNKDFTLFHFNNGIIIDAKLEVMAEDIFECMDNRGFGMLDISLDNAELAIEIWVKDRATDAVYLYMLFPYDMGVIEY